MGSGPVRSGGNGYLRPDQFLDHLTVINNNIHGNINDETNNNNNMGATGQSPKTICEETEHGQVSYASYKSKDNDNNKF